MIESQLSSPHPPVRQAGAAAQDDAVSNLNPTTNTAFSELWKEALERYKEKTGFDIRDKANDLSQRFDTCDNSGDALAVLKDLPVFRKANARPTWIKIKDSLKKVLDVVIFLNGLAAEVGNFVRRHFSIGIEDSSLVEIYWQALPSFGKAIFVGTGLLLKASVDLTRSILVSNIHY